MSGNNISSELSKLDELTSYFRKSDLIILAARPAMGKTTLSLNIANNIVSQKNKSVLFFSLDNSYKDLKERYKLNNEVSCFLENNNLDKATLIIEDTKDALEDIENKTREVCSQENIGLIIIDYLQYIEIKKDKFKIIYDFKEIDKYNKFNFEKLKRLKVLACEFNVPIICLYHLHPKLEERQDKHPQLSDFLEQTCIEENSDTIIFLYRDEYYNPSNSDRKGIAEVIIAKYDNKKDNIYLNFDSKLCVIKIKD
jgi:replicative DNA helicase